MKRFYSIRNYVLVVGLFVSVMSQMVWAESEEPQPQTEDKTVNPELVKTKRTEADFFTAVENVSTNVGPTVVAIRTEHTERYRPYYGGNQFDDDIFRQFFEDFFGEEYQQEFKSSGLGSGVIIDPKGYILTNEHVVEGADRILVRLADGREAKGILTGTDPRSDLAVIKIDLPELPFAKLGNSDDLKTGQWVVAIGNPFGYLLQNPEPTVTTGVISALQRSLPRTSRRDSDYSDLIQTDAAINPGNSGGPLVNLDGEIVGINVAIFTTTGGYQGIGFAIPISHAQRIISQLIKGEPVSYGWIGVSVQDIDQKLADYFDLKSRDGVVVTHVLEGSPGEKSGIQDSDIILSVDGKKTKNTPMLIRLIGDKKPGSKAALRIIRTGQEMDLSVEVGARPGSEEQQAVPQQASEPSSDDTKPETDDNEPVEDMKEWRGIAIENVNSSNVKLKHPGAEPPQGVVISAIQSGSPAEDTGLRKGDVIVSVNKKEIKNVGEFYKEVKKAQGECLIQTVRGYFVVKE